MSTDLPSGIKIYIIYYLYAFQSPTHDEIYVENYVKERQTYTVSNVGGVITYKNRAILVRQTAYFQNFFSSKMHVLTQGLNIFNF